MSTMTTTPLPTATESVVLHGNTRWSDDLSNYEFRDGVEFTVTFPGKQAITHREGSKCLDRVKGDLPTPQAFAKTKAEFAKQVALEAKGEDRTAWFCTRCLIHLPKNKLAKEQVERMAAKAAQTPAEEVADKAAVEQVVVALKPKPAGSKITRPSRAGRRTVASKKA